MLDKKQIQEIFLFEFKMGYKAAKTTCNINKALEPGTDNECPVQWWFKKFSKGDKSLEDEDRSAQSSEVDDNQLRRSSKLILLQLHKKLSKNSVSTILWSFGIWSKLKRWKSSISGCLMRWLKVQNMVILKCCLLLFFTTNHFSIRLWCAIQSGLYMITSDDQLSGWAEKKLQSTFQSQTCTKKVMVTLWWSAAQLIHYSFWIPVKPLHLRSMLSKSMRCTENFNACSWPWSTERAQFSIMPDHTSPNQHFKSWTNWTTKFCLIRHTHLASRQPTTSSSSILTTFCRENISTASRRQKILSKSSSNPEACSFTQQE